MPIKLKSDDKVKAAQAGLSQPASGSLRGSRLRLDLRRMGLPPYSSRDRVIVRSTE